MKSKAFCFWSFTLLGFPYLLISKLIFLIELFVRFLIYEKVCNFAIHIAINLAFDFFFKSNWYDSKQEEAELCIVYEFTSSYLNKIVSFGWIMWYQGENAVNLVFVLWLLIIWYLRRWIGTPGVSVSWATGLLAQ